MMARVPTALALGLLAGLLETAFLALRRLHPFDEHMVEVVAVALAASGVYFVAVWLAAALRQSTRPATGIILLAAVLFRLTLFDLPPSLSDDLYRYQWDAQLQLAGGNPYLVTPESRPFPEEVRAQLPASGYPTAYGPLTQLLFWLTALAGGGVLSFKLLSLLFDLGSLLVVMALLKERGLPVERALVYAWCPLVVVEFAGSGHNDSLTVFGILLACWLLARNRAVLSTASLAAAVLTKWFPALLLPVFLRRGTWKTLGVFASVLALGFLPYAEAGMRLFAGLRAYGEQWRNNASVFDLLRATSNDAVATVVAASALCGLAVFLGARRAEPLRAAYVLMAGLLLLSPSVFPWYLTWLIPFLCFFPHAAFLLWTATIFLSYHVLIGYRVLGTWQFDPTLVGLEYAPVFALLVVGWLRRNGEGRTPSVAAPAG